MMLHNVVLEFDAETKHYTGTVAGIPSIVVDALSEAEALKLATEAIGFYYEQSGPAPMQAKIVPVEV